MATKVKLRKKTISGNRHSLYLDFYPPISHPATGVPTRREFLGLYLFDKPKSQIDKQHNKDTQTLAESIWHKRENQLNKPEIYTGFEKEQLKIKERGEQSFIEYFKKLANKRKTSNHENWVSTFHYLERFTGGNLKFSDLNETFCNDFQEYLLTTPSTRSTQTTLSQNTAVSYFNKLKAALKQAYKDGYLNTDLNIKVGSIKQAETRRQYLTLEELNILAKSDCSLPILKQAALFSALTGLRFSDIQKLIWSELEFVAGQGYYIHFNQQKTKAVEALPISEQAYNLLGERRDPTDKVFAGLTYSAWTNSHLFKWLTKAGITKDIPWRKSELFSIPDGLTF